ncbi:MAG: phenylalanine--tRNA ligase subunit alpha [Candidatus Magasanikbacteria bacterium CG11_big_fil_rev_8_21_14_0_20_39_34]|uniref:Phenylalanine--tRNA ligase alpha subunit n=1 Tax=Candidatus Magasanikbacteria bacterium CG11_big_fil_rev_8_21_14_0_20_39_34 TaxID=1974653 RepID=A0A2H0N4K7_9BACT|nr:MAG: phenylalanine--tRNA ligase subunit alpha [Candidatus Magasanikbacteria bacterium CG11_big_fil_rev_8_21_14_0_20_39_34]
MKDELKKIQEEFKKQLKEVADFAGLSDLEQKFFSRKSGEFTNIMKGLRQLTDDVKKEMGQKANEVKKDLEGLFESKREEIQAKEMANLTEREAIDVTQPLLPKKERGHLHPITLAQEKMEDVAANMGFIIEDGPELESDYYVFGALNFPDDHPARESMDTFYVLENEDWCMRAHVSNMQVRLMRKYNEGGTKAVRAAYPGKVYRNEALDATHEHTFHQFEAFVVDKTINIGNLVAVIKQLLKGLYNRDVEVRLRPGYFPFVEPGFEMDMKCLFCMGKGCRVCKNIGWVEMLGCGLMHPNVLKEGGYDPNEWSGLAFGMGLTRLAMMRYSIEDIRHFMSGDLRFLEQF